MRRRVVVTGMGVVSPVGTGKRAFWDSLSSGDSGIDYVTKFDVSDFPIRIGGEVKDFNPEDYFDRKQLGHLDGFAIYALVAAEEAIKEAGLENGIEDMDRFGAVIGSGVGGIQTMEEQSIRLKEKGPRGISPYFVTKYIADIAPGQVSMKWGLRGPNYCTVSACASATHAIGDAMRLIQYGDADVMIAGGAEAPITPLCYSGFVRMKALSKRNDDPTRASRPFDADRDGFVISEGAGIIVLEEADHAINRGANIYGEVIGYGATADAYHLTAPAPGGEGAIRAMQRAIRDAGIDSDDVDYVNAHGTSTRYNDKTETIAIKKAFRDHAYRLRVSSTKSMTGHLMGASGGIEAIASLLAVNHNLIPPTINYETPDPECDLDYTANGAAKTQVDVAMSNSFGFGGHNAVLIMRRWGM